ncbi:hypothetical protein PENARI_c003G12314 [Penicillium arizonense]|uniref:Uncharacterized protein n=1 Tax=Penicillium arizonense TaxID=1835702 RepID=A0A1F5LSB5_PENAI|nr:hypothetical protein PENARI_c003G12314 [Penicillium arizonense]OGE55920.1 hypothetical protein PENARI_c003G12314 [Penicillium arizonense]
MAGLRVLPFSTLGAGFSPSNTDDSNGAALTEHKVTLQLQFGERLDLLIMGTQS